MYFSLKLTNHRAIMRNSVTFALCLGILLIPSCSTAPDTVHNRGIGVYPGDPAEDFSPTLQDGGQNLRNLAHLRIASHSSSIDCNRTAQLVTDGTPDGWKSLGASDEWIQVDLGTVSSLEGMSFSWDNPPVSGRILISDNASVWKEIAALGPEASPEIPKVRARYVRAVLDKTADGEPFELAEWEILGRGGLVTVPAGAALRTGSKQPLAGGAWKIKKASDEDGAEVSSAGFDDSDWMAATVPGTVLGSYVAVGAVPHPNFADNQLFISDSYFKSDFWYRDTFEARLDRPRLFLHFEGINWKAVVWLNGQLLGNIDGAFRAASFDVTGILREGRNDLAVRIVCNEHYGETKVQDAYTPLPNGGILGADNPTMHATIGWDWLPTVRGRNIGIYDEVWLAYTGEVTLGDPFVRTALPLPDTTRATILAEVTLVNHGDAPVDGTLKGFYGPLTFERQECVPARSSKRVILDPMTLEKPALWWPNGYGEPNLYPVEFRFETSDGAVSDSTSFLSGVRQMEFKMDPYEGMDPWLSKDVFDGRNPDQRLSLYINGRRFIGFGGNWGYPEHLLNYRSREYDIAVAYHAQMNFTMIRNWVGMTDSRFFYEACDRHGIMIWQDFWLANPCDGPDPKDPMMFNEVATEYVRRIRNHPSIALYVGRNEGYPPKEIDDYLAGLVAREHPGLYYISHSGTDGVSGGGPYRALPVKDYFHQFGHDRMHSERGMPCVMNYENLVRAMGPVAVEPVSSLAHPNPMYGLHDYTLGVKATSAQSAETFNELLAAAFGEPADSRTFAAEAQWINYDGYRAMFEGRSECRRGLLLWMTHPAWPSMVWQTYDYYFEPTAAFFGCRKACEPIHILLNSYNRTIEAVNYRAGDRACLTATARILRMDGSEAWSKQWQGDLKEDSTVTCFPLEVPGDITDVYFVKLSLTDAEGKVLSDNFYWQGKEEGNLKALHTLPKAKVRASAVSGGKGSFSVQLTNSGDTPALMLRLKVVDSGTGDLVLPVEYSDNYIFLMPGESRTLDVRVRMADCAGKPRIAIEGFNLDERFI